MNYVSTICLILLLTLSSALDGVIVAGEKQDTNLENGMADSKSVRVIHHNQLAAKIPCERISVGGKMGYKPNMVKLSNGELLMANFHTHYETQNDGSMCE